MQQDGATPLYIAAEKGHTESITLLLQARAAVDAKAEDPEACAAAWALAAATAAAAAGDICSGCG